MKTKYLKMVLAAVALASQPVQAQLIVNDLRVEHMHAPSVVDVKTPRFSWINTPRKNTLRGQRQTAYQLVVASSKENMKRAVYDVWDSGKVESDESVLVDYAGPALEYAKDYYWRVRTWDQNDRASAWSEPSSWGMGLKNDQWTAHWISAKEEGFGAPLFRKTFSTSRKLKQAKIFICGLGFFELYVNGQRIGDDYLVPNISTYSKLDNLDQGQIGIDGYFRDYRVLYLAYDVTTQMSEGKNAFGVMLGNGWYHPDRTFASTYGKACLRLQALLTYDDGTTDTLISDGSWKTHPSAIVYNGIYHGELYDACREVADWSSPEGSEMGWESVDVVEGPSGQMSAHTSPCDKITETLAPLSLRKTAPRTYEVDFGKEIAGWIYFSGIEGTRGDTLQVDYVCESEQGNQRYVFRGGGKEAYRPHFTWFTFSKAVIRGVECLTPDNLRAEAVNTDVPVTSEFETSNPLFNRIVEIWKRSQLDNMHGCIASDCPHRERLAYTGDGQTASEMVMLNFDAAAFYQKWIRDMRDTQNKETGYEPNSAPWAPHCGGGVGFGAAMSLMPWWYYVQYGDKRMLEDSYLNMKEEVRWLMTWLTLDGTMEQKMRNFHRGNEEYWLNLGEWSQPGPLPSNELVHTFFLWKCCDCCARAGRALGQTEEAAHYQGLADKVARNFHRRFYDPVKKSYGIAGSNVFALQMGVPDSCRNDVVDTLRKEIMEENNGHLHTGIFGTKYLFETLSDVGLTDVAVTILNQRDFPSYGWWVEQGATTTWEQWDCQNSHNHPMFGGGLTWFFRRLAGICADEKQPGYRHFIIRPCPTDLAKVYCSIQTPYGRIVSHITQKNGQSQLKLTIPVGSTALLFLPGSSEARELVQGTYTFEY
ncbi:MAG: alpha-L-rhamnosidase N-terminal domain-containing protein [Bacteroidaceae bacterium]